MRLAATRPSVELLTAQRVETLWPQLEPLFAHACAGNPLAIDITPSDILQLARGGLAVVFVAFRRNRVSLAMALQFHTTNGHKGVDIIAMAGSGMLNTARHFWAPVLDWLRANEVEFVDAYVQPRLARVCMAKLGFGLSCTMIRKKL